jgi:hypothetical protein
MNGQKIVVTSVSLTNPGDLEPKVELKETSFGRWEEYEAWKQERINLVTMMRKGIDTKYQFFYQEISTYSNKSHWKNGLKVHFPMNDPTAKDMIEMVIEYCIHMFGIMPQLVATPSTMQYILVTAGYMG